MAYDIFHNFVFDPQQDDKSLNESYNTFSKWQFVKSKDVEDADGFLTDYTWYTNGELHIFMFGDNDIEDPDEDYADHICETESEAEEWFNSYTGFEDFDGDTLEEELLTEDLAGIPLWLRNYLGRNKYVINHLSMICNIDLQHCKYIKCSPPRSNRDPILKDETKLIIYRLRDPQSMTDQVYIPGITSPELQDNSGNYITASRIPLVQLFDKIYEFGYIDLTDETQSNANIRQERRENAPDPATRRIPDRGLHYEEPWRGNGGGWVTTRGYDKSGYPIDATKYQKMLDDADLSTYKTRLAGFLKKLQAAQASMNDIVTQIDLEYFSSVATTHDPFSIADDVLGAFRSAYRSYVRLKNGCEDIERARVDDPEYMNDDQANKKISKLFKHYGGDIRAVLKDASAYLTELTSMFPEAKDAAKETAELAAET